MNNIAETIDIAVLAPDREWADVYTSCVLANKYALASVCVRPRDVSFASHLTHEYKPTVSVVIGFPHGEYCKDEKVKEALLAKHEGANEFDMVMPIYKFKNGQYSQVEYEISSVVKAVEPLPVKVIIETGFWVPSLICVACRLAEDAGAAYIKSCTGYGPRGVTLEDTAIMRSAVNIPIKASGGIKTKEQALGFINQGCKRLGIGFKSVEAMLKQVS